MFFFNMFLKIQKGPMKAPGSPHKTTRWLPDGPQMAHMRPQDVLRSLPSDTREAGLGFRVYGLGFKVYGWLAEHIPN